MATERDFELLDEYITHQLSGEEKAAFEERLAQDPALQQEYKFQESVAQGLRTARAAELKTMLNNIAIPTLPTAGTSVMVKVMVGVLMSGLVMVVGYLFLFDQHTPIQVTSDITSEVNPAKPEEQPTPAPPTTAPAETTPAKETPAQQQQTITPVQKPAMEVYNPTEDQEEAPASSGSPAEQRTGKTPSMPVHNITDNASYNFHYQFKDGQLYLYGPFEKNLYEIMEFFADSRHTMFLRYQEHYYLLQDNGDKIKALTPVQDQALIQKLNSTRGH